MKCKNRKSLLINHTATSTDGCQDRTADNIKSNMKNTNLNIVKRYLNNVTLIL